MTSLADWIFTKEADKNKKVLSTFSGEYSLADLEIKMHWFISLLNQEGNLKGKKVVILVPQIHSFLQILLAVNKLDGIVIPLSYQLREGDLQSILRFLDPHIIFSVKQFNGFNFETIITKWAESTGKQTSIYFSDGLIWSERYYFEGAPRLDETEEMDIIACTSGSTGVPKGIKLDNEYIIKNSMILASVLNIDKEDRVFQNINPSVAYGLMWLFSGLKVQFLTVAPEIFDVPKIVIDLLNTSMAR